MFEEINKKQTLKGRTQNVIIITYAETENNENINKYYGVEKKNQKQRKWCTPIHMIMNKGFNSKHEIYKKRNAKGREKLSGRRV